MGKRINEVGNKYGRLEVLEFVEMDNSGAAVWRCKCNCGNITIVRGSNLRSGKVKSCDCLRSGPNSTRAGMVGDKHPGWKGENSRRNIKSRLPVPEPKIKIKPGGKRGRPVGYKMSIQSKAKIAKSHIGQKHSDETKAKISRSVIHGSRIPLADVLAVDLSILRMRRGKSGHLRCGVPSLEAGIPTTSMQVHRIVCEQYLKRKLPMGSIVHHIEEIDNYSIDNLYICKDVAEHLKIHREDIVVTSNLVEVKSKLEKGEEIC